MGEGGREWGQLVLVVLGPVGCVMSARSAVNQLYGTRSLLKIFGPPSSPTLPTLEMNLFPGTAWGPACVRIATYRFATVTLAMIEVPYTALFS